VLRVVHKAAHASELCRRGKHRRDEQGNNNNETFTHLTHPDAR
jgi:hypothetical protein